MKRKNSKSHTRSGNLLVRLCGWIVSLMIISATGWYIYAFTRPTYANDYSIYVLAAMTFGLGIISTIYVAACNRTKSFPAHKPVLIFGSVLLALVKLPVLFILESYLSGLFCPSIHDTWLLIASLLAFAPLDLIFFIMLKRLGIPNNAKTYIFMATVFIAILLAPIIYGMIGKTISADSNCIFIVTMLAVYLVTGLISAVVGKLSQRKVSGNRQK